MYTIELYALTGAHSFGFRFPTINDAVTAAAIIGAKRRFEWGVATAFRVVNVCSGAVQVQAELKPKRRFTKHGANANLR